MFKESVITNLLVEKSYDETFNVASGHCDEIFFMASNESGKWRIVTNKKYLGRVQREYVFEAIKNYK
jgi:hypothetical protein